MTFQQFKNLSEIDQEFITWTRGTEISEREDKSNRYFLYQVDSFYIEVRCSKPYNIISGLFFFESVQDLEPYLALININAVYSYMK